MMKSITKFFSKFRRDEDGAVTVDWVVLTAVVVGLAVPIVTSIRGANDTVALKISSSLANKPVD